MTSLAAHSLSAEGVLAELRTSWLGRSVRVLETTTSTIDQARKWLRDGAPNGAVVMAESQTAGRGRRGRAWASPPGGLWMSVIVYPRIPAEAAGRLGAVLALATAESVSQETGAQVDVRWPNDVLIGGSKVGGVLAETEVSGAEIAAAVLSVGLNVNLSPADLPPQVKDLATTLLAETGRAHSLSLLAARLLEALEAIWPAVTGDGGALVARWRRRDALLGRKVRVEAMGKTLPGRAEGIDSCGHLELLADGVKSTIPAGELVSVREAQE